MIRPLRDILVLQPFGRPPLMAGALHLPETHAQKGATGCLCRVLAKGPTADEVEMYDIVHIKCYGPYPAGVLVVHEGMNLVLIRQRDINGVIKNYKPTADEKPWPIRADWDISVRQEKEET